MGFLSGLEFAFILVIVGLLLVLGTRTGRERRGLNPLLLVTIVILLFALFSLSGLVVALFKFSVLLIVIVAVLIVSLAYTTIRRQTP